MYNISNHYQNIYQYLKTIITDPRVLYLHPFGSTQPENIEIIASMDHPPRRGPLFIFYDQEPLNFEYNKNLFDYIKNSPHCAPVKDSVYRYPCILINTEQHSQEKDLICDHYGFAHVDYFFHIFAAVDWFRGHEYSQDFIAPAQRQLTKTYISFNRLTSNERVYRSLLVNELAKQNLLDSGYVSFSKNCPDGGDFAENLIKAVDNKLVSSELAQEAITNISTLPELRIDFADQSIPNQSMLLTPMSQLMQSFLFLVTETCYWQDKTHLTEKIFKPIVLQMPFILVGCVNNLAYLRSYGFKTFGDFWDESYDLIEDPILRLKSIVGILTQLSNLSTVQQQTMLKQMHPILEHNYRLFNSPEFVKREWQHLTNQLSDVCQYYQYKPPYRIDIKTGQAISIQAP